MYSKNFRAATPYSTNLETLHACFLYKFLISNISVTFFTIFYQHLNSSKDFEHLKLVCGI